MPTAAKNRPYVGPNGVVIKTKFGRIIYDALGDNSFLDAKSARDLLFMSLDFKSDTIPIRALDQLLDSGLVMRSYIEGYYDAIWRADKPLADPYVPISNGMREKLRILAGIAEASQVNHVDALPVTIAALFAYQGKERLVGNLVTTLVNAKYLMIHTLDDSSSIVEVTDLGFEHLKQNRRHLPARYRQLSCLI